MKWQSAPEYLALCERQRNRLDHRIGSSRSCSELETELQIPADVIKRLRAIRRLERANSSREMRGAKARKAPDFLAALAAAHPYGCGEINRPRIGQP